MAHPSITESAAGREKIEILSVSLLRTLSRHVEEFRELSARLGLSMGWHYLLDLAWAAHELGDVAGKRVLDAGSGQGLIQWWLVERGADVIAVDRLDRRRLFTALRSRYRVQGLRPDDLGPWPKPPLRSFLPPRSPRNWGGYPRKLAQAWRQLLGKTSAPSSHGTVSIYHQDLTSLVDIRDSSVDAVVSISALEHNTAAGLAKAVTEFNRVLKPGGKIIATLGAARDEDWFHEPSRGWCFTETTLRRAFDLPDDAESNYARHDELMAALRECRELREGLDPAYALSGDNGMPWGIWDPKYQTVGVVKVRRNG